MKHLAGALVLAGLLCGCGAEAVPVAAVPGASSPAVSPGPPSPPRTGPVGDGGAAASCVEAYEPTTIGNRAFAFDGTVTAIGTGSTNKADKGALDTAAVTFAVNEWFKGGSDGSVTVDLMAPNASSDEPPAYEQGSRLLVSGEPRWGGAPLDDAIAWSCGGFTRYYEPAVADDWRTSTS